jgi:hypothetical protein
MERKEASWRKISSTSLQEEGGVPPTPLFRILDIRKY